MRVSTGCAAALLFAATQAAAPLSAQGSSQAAMSVSVTVASSCSVDTSRAVTVTCAPGVVGPVGIASGSDAPMSTYWFARPSNTVSIPVAVPTEPEIVREAATDADGLASSDHWPQVIWINF